jgi:hypothetical protein
VLALLHPLQPPVLRRGCSECTCARVWLAGLFVPGGRCMSLKCSYWPSWLVSRSTLQQGVFFGKDPSAGLQSGNCVCLDGYMSCSLRTSIVLPPSSPIERTTTGSAATACDPCSDGGPLKHHAASRGKTHVSHTVVQW